MDDLLRRHLGANAAVVLDQRLPSVRLIRGGPVPADDPGTRFGGQALLPPGTEWPQRNGYPLTFLGQIRVDEVARFEERLPGTGGRLLAFFYDLEQAPWGFDPADADGCRVIPVDPDTAVAVDPPEGTEAFAAHDLALQPEQTLPNLAEPVVRHIFDADEDGVRAYWEALDDAGSQEPVHRMFGWPELIQNPMQLECQLASNGVYCGNPEGYRDPRVEQLRDGAGDWVLLLQIDSDDDIGWMWGDVGRLYFWIREDDLRAGNFDKVWLILQCF